MELILRVNLVKTDQMVQLSSDIHLPHSIKELLKMVLSMEMVKFFLFR